MERTAARAGDYVRHEFEVRSLLMGVPGIGRNVVSLIVPPRGEKQPPAPISADEIRFSKRPSLDQHE